MPILEKNSSTVIREKELKNIVKKKTKEGLKEIIFALSVNPEGEDTTQYLKKELAPLLEQHKIKTSTLGRGLSTGSELEYSDTETIKNALKNRV